MAPPVSLPAETPPLPRGTVLGEHYRLDALLGRGESGAVYNAWDLQEGHACAIKVLRPELAGLTAALLRLRQDNREIARLQHPHLQAVRLINLPDQNDQRVLLHRELWYGETLRQRLQAGPLDAAELSRVFGPLCGALQASFNQGVLHGDLKPENLLFGVPAGAINEQEPTLRVLDFGMHHLRAAESGIGSHPLLGTLSYLAPEQVQEGADTLDLRSDQFALGAILYECVTGQPAFAADGDGGPGGTSVLAKICLLPPPRPSQAAGAARLSAGLLRNLDDIIARACQRDPGARYPSPEALWAALSEALTEGLIPAAATTAAAPSDDGAAPAAPSRTSIPPRALTPPRGATEKGARAIELFKALEASGRARNDEPSVEIRRAAAIEAATQLAASDAGAGDARPTLPLKTIAAPPGADDAALIESQRSPRHFATPTQRSQRQHRPTQVLGTVGHASADLGASDEDAELLAAITPPLWRRLLPVLIAALVLIVLIALSVRGR